MRPFATRSSAARRAAWLLLPARSTGIWPEVRNNQPSTGLLNSGRTRTASNQKNEGRRFSERGFSAASDAGGWWGTPPLSFEFEVRPEELELRDEVLVPARDDA